MKKIFYNIYTVIFLGLSARIFAALFYADTILDNEWGKLVHNLFTTGVFGINVVENNFVKHAYAAFNDQVLPSIYMPPLYGYFIYLIKLIFGHFFEVVKIVLIFQIILSIFTIQLFFKLVKKFFCFNISFFSTLVFTLLPINIIATVQISSVSIQLFLLLIFLYFFVEYFEQLKIRSLVFFSISSGLLLLTRAEFIVFYLLTIFFLFFYKKINLKKIVLSFIIFLTILSPYLLRNYLVFDRLILTKSFGYNLLKGNNPESTVEGSDYFIGTNFDTKSLDIKINNEYEIKLDNFYKEKAIGYIKQDPFKYFKLFISKFFSFLFFDINSTYPNYYNVFHIIPKLIISILSFIAAIISLKSNKDSGVFKFLSLMYFSNILLFSVFFILPRYSLMLLPLQLLLISKFFSNFINK